jgi:thioredoxin reductase (NADPH)
MNSTPIHDLLVVGAGPTGIAIGAEAKRRGLDVILVDRGAITSSLLGFPTYMQFFTTRDLMEIADVPFAVPQDKPDRRQALLYYRAVVDRYDIPVATLEEVREVVREDGRFRIESVVDDRSRTRRSRAVALATGYFDNPGRLGIEGEDLPWVHHRYVEPYGHFQERVVVIGGGNSALECALDLWRNGARVTLVHRGETVKPSVKYWLRPDFLNRVDEGSVEARMSTLVTAFDRTGVRIEGPNGAETLEADAAYILVGYRPDVELELRCGIEVDPDTLVPNFDPTTCETNVSGLYVAGTLQAGRDTNRIFIENSREHAPLIVDHLTRRFGADDAPASKAGEPR